MKTLRTTAILVGLLIAAAANSSSFAYKAAQTGPTGSANPDTGMMAHGQEMQDQLKKLRVSFQAVVDGRDSNGYVKDKALLKVHQADLNAFRQDVKKHKLLTADYESWCGSTDKKKDAMELHQKKMKAIMYDLVDSYDTYMAANDSSIETSEPAEDALRAHRAALDELGQAIQEHQVAMAAEMKTCKA